jgi:hypothetical protein
MWNKLNDVCFVCALAPRGEQLKTMPVQTASGKFGADIVKARLACGEDTSVSA